MKRKLLARKITAESVVLLKNEDSVLPLQKNEKVAFFGRSQIHTVFSGSGSGASKSQNVTSILPECEKQGLIAAPDLKEFYLKMAAEDHYDRERQIDYDHLPEGINSGIMYELFGRYHAPAKEYGLSEELLEDAWAFTDLAVMVIGRNSGGEECDRYLEQDYYLTETEEIMVHQVCSRFHRVVLILNINGLIDLAWTEKYPSIKAILFAGVCGEQGAAAIAEILTGKVNPSGKLAVTIAKDYYDYPSAKHFSWEKNEPDKILTYESYGLDAVENGSIGFKKSPVTVYWEDIYSGYRYFDTFGKKPLYPFGFGLSYTSFAWQSMNIQKTKEGLKLTVQIKNSGKVSGREVLQAYISAEGTKTERPFQELKGFAKTRLLSAGECETVCIEIPWQELACFVTEKAAYVIEKGNYVVNCGNSSANLKPMAMISVSEDILIQQCANRLGMKNCNERKLSFLSGKQGTDEQGLIEEIPCVEISGEEIFSIAANHELHSEWVRDLSGFSVKELAALCVGYGPGIPFSAFSEETCLDTIYDENGRPLTTNSHPTGFNGYVSPAMEEKNIYSVFYKDGPSGIGETAWPTEMLMACAFDRELWQQFGETVREECENHKVDVWLAPAVNLHRNPLCGRNFEYFSEDPYLTGVCACEITRGIQKNGSVIVCPKHFAINEQETFRRGSAKKHYDAVDSIISERAARELYLKPFEMLVKEVNISCLMTSFNKINGVFAGGNKDLCSGILREEWGFRGAIVTDWGDMDIVVDGADAVAAGNDIVMPGGPPVIRQILKGYEDGRVSRAELEKAVNHLLFMGKTVLHEKNKVDNQT